MELIVLALYLGGFFFFAVGSLGLFRLPDALSRLHATTLTDTLGSTLILAGCTLKLLPHISAFKIVLIWVLVLVINPTMAHLIGQFAWGKEQQPSSPERRQVL